MKSLIIFLSLLIFSEIQLILSSDFEDDSVINLDDLDEVNPETSDQNGQENSEPESTKPVQIGESPTIPDPIPLVNQVNVSKKPSVTPDEEVKVEQRPTSAAEMKKKATARRDETIKKAKSVLEQVKADIETLRENAEVERDEAFKKNNEQFKKAESMTAAVGRRASKKFAEAKQRYREEYKQAKSAADQKFKEAAEKYNDALEAADEEFEKARSQIEENKRKVESENQEVLQKALKEKEEALKSAKEKRKRVVEKYRKLFKNGRMSQEEREKIQNQYQEEIDKFDEEVELAENAWEKVLDDLGIGSQYKAAEEEALQKLEQAQQKAGSILHGLSDEREKTLEEAKMRKQEAKRQAKAVRSKAEDECDEILEKAEKQQNIASKKIWAKWRQIQTQANDKLKAANSEFFKANYAAINEYKKALQTVEEMERKMAKVASTENPVPDKIMEKKSPVLLTPRRRSKKFQEET